MGADIEIIFQATLEAHFRALMYPVSPRLAGFGPIKPKYNCWKLDCFGQFLTISVIFVTAIKIQ